MHEKKSSNMSSFLVKVSITTEYLQEIRAKLFTGIKTVV